MESILAPLISSGIRAKLLMRFFANPARSSYLRALANDFSVSPNAVREELLKFSQAHLLTASKQGREVHYRANEEHPLFAELVSMAQKALGIDKIIENILATLGRLDLALVLGDYAAGRDSGLIDLVLVGRVDRQNLADIVARTEKHLGRKIRTLVLDPQEFQALEANLLGQDHIILWQNGGRVGNERFSNPRPTPPAGGRKDRTAKT